MIRPSRIPPIAAAALTAAALVALVHAETAPGPRAFKPPRVAVVDIAEVFEKYTRKKDLEAKLKGEAAIKDKQLEGQKAEYQKLLEELKNVQEGSDQHRKLTLKRIDLEYNFKNQEKEIYREFQEKQLGYLREMREAIVAEIQAYAVAMEIDLVLQKKGLAEQGGKDAVPWPYVHYVKPELEITGDITRRMNAKYTQP